mmetsp:Transcript_6276/g.15911  ORF Transcript_6276/g.15911 Transcript_6276/m.15911 type:complete len:218 (+) Transcript_6276:2255-2908(+)
MQPHARRGAQPHHQHCARAVHLVRHGGGKVADAQVQPVGAAPAAIPPAVWHHVQRGQPLLQARGQGRAAGEGVAHRGGAHRTCPPVGAQLPVAHQQRVGHRAAGALDFPHFGRHVHAQPAAAVARLHHARRHLPVARPGEREPGAAGAAGAAQHAAGVSQQQRGGLGLPVHVHHHVPQPPVRAHAALLQVLPAHVLAGHDHHPDRRPAPVWRGRVAA